MSTLLALSLFACNRGPATGDAIQLQWDAGDTFYIEANYRLAEIMTEENPTDLEGNAGANFGEAWSEDVTWTYQVVESGFTPDEGDELYEYALKFDGSVAPISVIKTYLEDNLNGDAAMLEADPVIYLVFREDRDRLAGLISFVNVDGEREQQAWSSKELGRSYQVLSQSMLTHAPTYLAPFGAVWGDDTKVLENGSLLDSVDMGEGITDVFFDDELGGGLVSTRYEANQPWPTWTVSDSFEARLLTADQADAKRSIGPGAPLPEAPEDFDYRSALSASIDIDASLSLDAETMGGGFSAEVYEEFRPWAGSWWPLKSAALVFGYDGRDTLSERIKDDVDPLKKEMDALSDEIRDMEDGDDKDAKRTEYSEKQSEVVSKLVEFYNTVQQDLDGGRLTVAEGSLTHVDGWSYDLDELSPMDKFALELYDAGTTSSNPFYLSAWEILNSYNPVGGSWWGHCNGWAAAAILTNEPREPISVDIMGESVEFTTADVKGLLTEAHYSTYSRFYGSRYYKDGDDIADLHPEAFHRLITFYLKEQRVPLVFDTDAEDAVWNFPAWGADLAVEETTEADPNADKININTADMDTLDTLPGVGESKASAIIEHREAYGPFQSIEDITDVYGVGNGTLDDIIDLITVDVADGSRSFYIVADVKFTTDGVDETHVDGSSPESFTETWAYTLTTDANGLVIEGTWADESEHPDFAWVPYHNPDTGSNSENPYLPYGSLLDVIGEEIERH